MMYNDAAGNSSVGLVAKNRLACKLQVEKLCKITENTSRAKTAGHESGTSSVYSLSFYCILNACC